MINNLGLRTKWYPIFLPKTKVSKFSIKAWRIIVINSGEVPGKPLLCQRYDDNKKENFSFSEIEKDFLPEDTYIKYVEKNGFELIEKKEGVLKFKSLKFLDLT